MTTIRYVKHTSAILKRKPTEKSKGVELLLGARLHLDDKPAPEGWAHARQVPNKDGRSKEGYIEEAFLSARQMLKIFYVDVGQGDATLIEAEDAVVIIDGGPNDGFFDRLKKRLAALRRADKDAGLTPRNQLRINAIIVSHFDLDHYAGLTKILRSKDFIVDRIYHNGLPRYGENQGMDLDLGAVVRHADGRYSIDTQLNDLTSAQKLLDSGKLVTKSGNPNRFSKFLSAAIKAKGAGRLGSMQKLYRRKPTGAPQVLKDLGPDLKFEILGPMTTKQSGSVRLAAFHDPHDQKSDHHIPPPSASHTINGNSIVLRLRYGESTFLFGGDLNQPAQKYLAKRYGNLKPFAADVNKACHHGSSDFDLGYLKAVAPHATVFSSGDNGSYDHPLPDAMGAAAKHSRGEFPVVFSTELAREGEGKNIKFGDINARSNGETVVMAQKKEKPSSVDPWHTFVLPHSGPFGH